jgi:hypothetical protein
MRVHKTRTEGEELELKGKRMTGSLLRTLEQE